MSKKRIVTKDPGVVQDELLRKTEELRLMKQRMNELQEEHKKVKTTAVRLERLAKREDDGSTAGSTLNPRDAASTSSMIQDQKRLLEEKDRKIKALLAGNRMENIGGKKLGTSNPATVYGIKRPKKLSTAQTPSRKLNSSQGSRSNLNSSRGPQEANDDEPDFQAAPINPRSPIRQSAMSPTPRKPSLQPVGGGDAGAKDEAHYLEFNKRLQERLNSSQNFHRNQLALDQPLTSPTGGAGGSGGSNPGPSGSFFEEDNVYPGPSGAEGGDMNELVWIRKELRAKKAKIAALQSHFEHLTVSFRVEKDLQKITLAQCEELKQTVATLQARERNYQRQLESLEDHRLQLENQASIITDLQADKRGLEERIQQLHTNLFQGDTMEALRHKQLLNEHSSSVVKLQHDLEEKDRAIKSLKQANASLLERTQFNEQLLRDKKDLQKENTDLRQKCVELTEKLVVFSVDSGVEVEDLERALDIVRRQRSEDVPSRVSFLNSTEEKSAESDPALDTIPSLRRKYQELELKTRDYILELQQKTDMLNTQYSINKDQKKKNLELTKRATSLQVEVERLRYELTHRPAIASCDNLSESIFAMSEDGEGDLAADQLTGLENLIAFRVISATYNAASSAFMGDASPLTFLTADFYEFETSFSEVFGGFNPNFKFTTQYQVDTDQFLVSYLESEELVLTLYQQLQGTSYKKLAVCYIPLRGLLSPNAGIEGRAQLIQTDNLSLTSGGVRGSLRDGVDDGDDVELEKKLTRGANSDAVIGEIHYVMRMKRPILSTPPSPSTSQPATPRGSNAPVQRQGTLVTGAHQRTQQLASQQQQSQPSQPQSAFQPSAPINNFTRQPSQPSRATMQPSTTSSTASSSHSSSPVTRQRSIQPSQQQQQFQRQQSTVNTKQTSGLSMDDFDQQPQSSASSSTSRPSIESRQPSVNPSSAYSRQTSFAATKERRWDEELDDEPAVHRRPTLQPQTTSAFYTQTASAADTGRSDRSSGRNQFGGGSGLTQQQQEQKDIEDILNNPDAQDDLFGNRENSDRKNITEEEF